MFSILEKKKAEKRLDIGTKHDQTMFKMSNPATLAASSSIIQHLCLLRPSG
jgi:hypothetical protein